MARANIGRSPRGTSNAFSPSSVKVKLAGCFIIDDTVIEKFGKTMQGPPRQGPLTVLLG